MSDLKVLFRPRPLWIEQYKAQPSFVYGHNLVRARCHCAISPNYDVPAGVCEPLYPDYVINRTRLMIVNCLEGKVARNEMLSEQFRKYMRYILVRAYSQFRGRNSKRTASSTSAVSIPNQSATTSNSCPLAFQLSKSVPVGIFLDEITGRPNA